MSLEDDQDLGGDVGLSDDTDSGDTSVDMEDEEAKPSVDQCHQFIIVIEGNQVDCNDSYHLDWPGLAWHATLSRASTQT